MNVYKDFIINFLNINNYNFHIVNELNDDEIFIVYNLFNNNQIIDDNKLNTNCLYFYGIYFYEKGNYELMKKYYFMAIENNNDNAMYNLAYYYEDIENNYELMKKYLLMAIDKNNSKAMNNLAVYYYNIENNYKLAKKYYLMAIDKENDKAMYNLAFYFQNIEKNYELMKKYYFMAIDKGNVKAMYNLGSYYKNIEKNYELMKRYYLMAIESDNNILKNIFKNIKNIDNKLIKLKIYLALLPKINDKKEIEIFINKNNYLVEIYNKNIKNKNKIKELENKIKKLEEENIELKYQPGGIGYLETKEHFNMCLKEFKK